LSASQDLCNDVRAYTLRFANQELASRLRTGHLIFESCRADVGAVWVRSALLGLMVKQGVLADWQHGTQLNDGVYRVAATMPLNGFQFDPIALVRRLREEFSGQS
jgi:hypothetical protein